MTLNIVNIVLFYFCKLGKICVKVKSTSVWIIYSCFIFVCCLLIIWNNISGWIKFLGYIQPRVYLSSCAENYLWCLHDTGVKGSWEYKGKQLVAWVDGICYPITFLFTFTLLFSFGISIRVRHSFNNSPVRPIRPPWNELTMCTKSFSVNYVSR